ncbi:MAG: VWA domain-containing protein [Gammaproteobacteria bacterium]|nr:VWA domain-containing protein [Gammaproteobacteria bacterium]MBT6700569.1 VWA domain-containing protein [Gammaproteobacteria bacterium]
MHNSDLEAYREKLKCNFPQIQECFEDFVQDAIRNLSNKGIDDYLSGASLICMIGRGWEPVSIYLEEMPEMANQLGEEILEIVSKSVWDMSRSPNGKAIPPFMMCLPEASRRLGTLEQMQHFFEILEEMVDETTTSVHGHHKTHSSQGFLVLLEHVPYLLSQLSLEGFKNWVEYGTRNYKTHPERQKDYFSLQSADSKAMLQRERHGTLFMDNDRQLDMYLRGLWEDESYFVPYSLGFDELRKPVPYYDALGIRVPDVYDERNGVSGIDRYRVTIAHIAGHRKWTSVLVADNLSPFQRIAAEHLEDSRIEYLMLKEYPGMRKLLLALHPVPVEGDCDNEKESCIRHRLAMLSRAILDENHGYKNEYVLASVEKFYQAMSESDSSTEAMRDIAISFVARTRLQSDQLPKMHFENTEVDYRDDNRHMWIFIEENDEAEDFEHREKKAEQLETDGLPPRHYPEWDYKTNTFKPDWVTLYESVHPSTNSADIDAILDKHKALAKLLKAILDSLKPQQKVRVRYQEEGSELDLDVAIRSLIDYKCGAQPDPRINMSHENDGRDIAVMLLLDLSASLNDKPEGSDQTILELSQEAVSLLAWTIEQLGDKYAIAGFHSDTRHNVRYYHLKGYSEHFDDAVKGRLAAMDAGFSTRMGGAIRHASHYLEAQKADKKLMLILTDGEPSDIDVDDEQYLISDTKKAIDEISSKGMSSYCISLDKKADDYIAEIFGNQYTVIDHVDRLPEQLPKLFMSLTK